MTVHTLSRARGRRELQSLGGMVGPITFRVPYVRPTSPMQMAPMGRRLPRGRPVPGPGPAARRMTLRLLHCIPVEPLSVQ
jgi:hypothetical protein